MSIPQSGVYKLNVIQLSSWGYINGKAQYIIGASGGGSSNINSPQVDVTFDGRTFSFTDSTGKQQAITYGLVARCGDYHYNSVIVKGLNSGVWWLISAEPEKCTVSGTVITHGYQRDLSDSSDWNFGARIYNITKHKAAFNANPVVCFLNGTRLKTPQGECAVELLHPHDEVTVYCQGTEKPGVISWVGHGGVTVRPELQLDMAGYPICITKGALSKGVPTEDLLLTAEHRLFFKDKLVPARLIVNNRSIFYDKTISFYDYCHIEAKNHFMVMANGVLVESNLASGASHPLVQDNKATLLAGQDAVPSSAPAEADSQFIEGLYQQLLKRAEKLHVPVRDEAFPLTSDAALHLVTENGQIIRAARKRGDDVLFLIPEGVENVRIVSNASRPCDVVGAYVDDKRYFGVAVGEVKIFRKNKPYSITEHLTRKDLSGWMPLENPAVRWTTGNAFLPLGEGRKGEMALLSLQVTQAGPYVMAPFATMVERRRA